MPASKNNLNLISKVADKAKDLASFVKSNPLQATMVVNTLNNIKNKIFPEAPKVSQGTLDTVMYLNIAKYVVLILLIAWGLFLIISRFTISNEQTKEDIKVTNQYLVGNYGILPMILSAWVAITVLMLILPEINLALSSTNSIFSTVKSYLPFLN